MYRHVQTRTNTYTSTHILHAGKSWDAIQRCDTKMLKESPVQTSFALQCAAVCSSVQQYAPVRSSVQQCAAVYCSVLHFVVNTATCSHNQTLASVEIKMPVHAR